MKKLIRIAILFSFILVLCISCYAKTVKHNLAETSITLEPNDKVNLRIPGVKAKNVVWKSKNKAVAKVNKSGVATALKEGNTKITGKYGKITFTVNISIEKTKQIEEKLYNKLLYTDDKISVYLYKKIGGEVFLRFESKIEEMINYDISYIEINGNMYRSTCGVPYLYKNLPAIFQLQLSTLDYKNDIDYSFSNEKIKMYGEYYYNTADHDQPHFVANFNIDL